MIKHLQLICCILLFDLSFISAQQLFVEKYPVNIYGGAIQSWTMAQDKEGVLYIANNDGVLRYDGLKWDLTTITDQNYVFSLGLNSKNDIFIGSYNELGYLRKDSAANYKYHSLLPLVPKQYKSLNDVVQTIVFNDEVIFNNKKNIFLYKNGRIKVLAIKNAWLFKLKKQLFSTNSEGLWIYKNGEFEDAGFGKELELAGIHLKRIADYENGQYLLLDDNNRVWVLNPLGTNSGKRLRLITPNPVTHSKTAEIRGILYLDNSKICVFTAEGIVFLNKEGKTVNFISKDVLGLNLNSGFIFQDMNHNTWLGTDSFISQIITSSPLSIYNKQNGLEGNLLSFGKKDQHLYVGTDKGLFYRDENATFSLVPGTAGENWNMFNFNQKLYLAHRDGVFEIEGKKATLLVNHLFIQTIGEVRNRPDCMIMGTYNTGIWLLEKRGNAWHQKKIKGFEEETRFIQQDDEGDLWISHYNKGIFKLRLNAQMDSVTGTTFYNTANGLPSNLNNRIYRLKNGKIIVTTTDGIYNYNKIKNRFEPDAIFRKATGKGFCIYTLAENANGDIYFWGAPSKKTQTAGALIKQPGGSFKLFLTPFSKISTNTHGLLRIDVDAPLLIAGPDEVWIGNVDKIISYNRAQKTYYNKPFKLSIKAVLAADSTIFTSGGKLPQNELAFSQNKLKFIFASSFYEDADKIEYQYKLKGFENKWSTWNKEKEALFTNLANGNYTFFVRAKNIYGQITAPVSYSFHINAPWYKTWWAYLLYLLLALLAFYLVNIFNTSRIRRQKLVLERKVNEKTIELSGKNDEILAQSKALQELNLTKDKLFSIISHDLRGPIGQLKQTLDLVKSGDLSLEELETLIPELDDNIGSTFSLTDNLLYWAQSQMEGIQVKPAWFNAIDIAEENYNLFKLNADAKNIRIINNINKNISIFGDMDMIRLVLRNLINNAIKFTPCDGTIVLGYSTQPGFVEVYVQDTGNGMSETEIDAILKKENFHKDGTSGEKGSGLGLMLCQDFIAKNNGKLTIESKLGVGSKISFWLKGEN